jgi:hypothetical protein
MTRNFCHACGKPLSGTTYFCSDRCAVALATAVLNQEPKFGLPAYFKALRGQRRAKRWERIRQGSGVRAVAPE